MRVTKEMIVEAGLGIIREEGEDKLTVRNVAARLGCSTQPVMYCFPTMVELRDSILENANSYHIGYLMKNDNMNTDILIGIGLNYIRFAAEERNLFRFIAMSDNSGGGLAELINSDDTGELLVPLERMYGLTHEQSRNVFEALFVCFHGYAALMAYSTAKYDHVRFKKQLIRVYRGIITEIKREAQTRNNMDGTTPLTL